MANEPTSPTTTWPFPRRMTVCDHRTGDAVISEMLSDGSTRIVSVWDRAARKWVEPDVG